jgi:hypothetical protein
VSGPEIGHHSEVKRLELSAEKGISQLSMRFSLVRPAISCILRLVCLPNHHNSLIDQPILLLQKVMICLASFLTN